MSDDGRDDDDMHDEESAHTTRTALMHANRSGCKRTHRRGRSLHAQRDECSDHTAHSPTGCGHINAYMRATRCTPGGCSNRLALHSLATPHLRAVARCAIVAASASIVAPSRSDAILVLPSRFTTLLYGGSPSAILLRFERSRPGRDSIAATTRERGAASGFPAAAKSYNAAWMDAGRQ